MENSDTDPDFKEGLCEVRRCKEELRFNCSIFVCYNHCVEDIASYKDRGKTLEKIRKAKKTRQMKKNKNE